MGDIEIIAYESALRALDKQERVLDELRSRTGLLLAASSLAVSFLGRPAVTGARSVVVVSALVAFAFTILASVYVLLPKSGFYFSMSGRVIYEQLYEFRDDPTEVRRRLVYDLQRFWDANDVLMRRLFKAFGVAALGLLVEIALLLAAVSNTLV